MKYKNEIRVRQIINSPFWRLRVLIKYLLLKLYIRRTSFCKCCGIDVRDYDAPDYQWERVCELSGNKNVLCWNCFCDYEYLSR